MKVALALHRIGLKGSLMHSLGMGSILAAISLWGRSAAVSDKDRKALNAWPSLSGFGHRPSSCSGRCCRTSRQRRRSRSRRPVALRPPGRLRRP
jgi:hypothetical protein